MSIINMCAVSKQGSCSVQLLKSDMLADSIYRTQCTTARPAVQSFVE